MWAHIMPAERAEQIYQTSMHHVVSDVVINYGIDVITELCRAHQYNITLMCHIKSWMVIGPYESYKVAQWSLNWYGKLFFN
jgi:ribulose 1,5-bisphosphate carboxylase large subunit-like protein